RARDAGRAPGAAEHALAARGGQHARPGAPRGGDVRDVHRLLRARGAAGEALAAPAAAAHVALDRLGRVAELLAALAEERVAPAEHGLGRRRDAEELADRVVVGIEVGARRRAQLELLAPAVEHEIRRAHADRGVDERAAAEADRLHRR